MVVLRQLTDSELLVLVEASGAAVDTVRRYLRGEDVDPRREPRLRRALIRHGWQRIIDTAGDEA